MIRGIGTDIVEIDRIREAVNKWGEKFLKRIFSRQEIDYCFFKRDPFPHLSARFAAKEATIKAMSGLIPHIFISDVEVSNEPSGRPYIVLNEGLTSALSSNVVLHLTMTHERSHASATVIAEQIDQSIRPMHAPS